MPLYLTLKAEALHLADRTSEGLEAINEAEALAERSEQRFWCAELHRLRGMFLATLGADEAQIETSFCEAIKTAREQKSISLEIFAQYRFAHGSFGSLAERLAFFRGVNECDADSDLLFVGSQHTNGVAVGHTDALSIDGLLFQVPRVGGDSEFIPTKNSQSSREYDQGDGL
jgi:hypothetical protein